MNFVRSALSILPAVLMSSSFAFAQDATQAASTLTSKTTPRGRLPLPYSQTVRISPSFGAGPMQVLGEGNPSILNYDSTTAMSAGLRVSIVNYVGYEFETGLLYVQTGQRYSSSVPQDWRAIETRENLLSIPILAKVNFSGDPGTGVYFKAGLMPSAVLSATTKIENVGGSTLYSSDMTDLGKFDALAVAGVGFNVPVFERNSITFDLTYNRGLLPVLKNWGESQTFRSAILATASVGFGL